MEGYSVTEAASVLGVPTERVWELLARGVLSGAPEGETGMRVFLQPRPAPAPIDEARAGNGRESDRPPEVEASPFRELLTEFRNLTERYGQALLALGEARGEVASLRSRVDLLEARFDLRLPMSAPMQPRPAVVEPARSEATAEGPAAEAEVEPDEQPRRRRSRAHRRATDEFAEALARAEDPTPAELPGGRDAAAAYAAFREEAPRGVEQASPDIEASLPRELPAAESIATLEPETAAPAPEPETWDEPSLEPAGEAAPPLEAEAHARVEVEAGELDVPQAEVAEVDVPEVEATAVEPAPEAPEFDEVGDASGTLTAEAEVATEPELVVAAEPAPYETTDEPEPTPEHEPELLIADEAEAEPGPMPDEREQAIATVEEEVASEPEAVASQPWADEVGAVEPIEAALPETAEQRIVEMPAEPGTTEAEPTSWDRGRYSTAIEEPDWIPEEREPGEHPAQPAAHTEPEPAVDRPEPDAFGWDREETTVWFGSGSTTPVADDEPAEPDEPPTAKESIDAERSSGDDAADVPIEADEPPDADEPASTDDDPAAEMEVASASGHTPAPPAKEPEPASDVPPSPPPAPWAPAPSPPPPWAARGPVDPMPPATSVQVTSGPASRAYRRLRRIFPG